MIKVPYETIVGKIQEKTGLTAGEIEEKIQNKMNQLAGLVSREGAAHIIANEHGVKLFDEETGRLKINSLLPGMRNVEITGRVKDIFEARSFQSGTRTGMVGSFLIADETGGIRIVLWGSQTDKLKELEKGMVVKVQFAYVKDNQGRKEVHLRDNSNIILNPPDEVVGEMQDGNRKAIADLTEQDDNAEVVGIMVQVFDPKFFEVCPHCNRKVKQQNTDKLCDTHGAVTPSFSYVANMVLDDGTATIRTVFFSNQLQRLTNKSHDELQAINSQPIAFETIRQDVLGKTIKILGRVKKNTYTDRIELTANRVVELNPQEEIERLRKIKGVPAPVPAAADDVPDEAMIEDLSKTIDE
ncbi:MAG: OB-fold nucleic acid binding domain-containing protein [Candidatus Woesearchaeota archaeon]|nr:OB-fold nucleic acid binding domain-containing protein [Candidatus Woesearchaeota archaeon]